MSRAAWLHSGLRAAPGGCRDIRALPTQATPRRLYPARGRCRFPALAIRACVLTTLMTRRWVTGTATARSRPRLSCAACRIPASATDQENLLVGGLHASHM